MKKFQLKVFGGRKTYYFGMGEQSVKQKINRSNKSTLHPSSGDAVTVAAAFGGLENIPLHKKHGSLVASLLVLELRH